MDCFNKITKYQKAWNKKKQYDHFFFNDSPVKVKCKEIKGGAGYVLLSHDKEDTWFDVYIHIFDKDGNPYNWYTQSTVEDNYLPGNDKFINDALKAVLGYEHPKKSEGYMEGRAEMGMQGDTYIVVEITNEFEEWLEKNYKREVKKKEEVKIESVITEVKRIGEVYTANDGNTYLLTGAGWYKLDSIKNSLVTSADFGELCEAHKKITQEN